MSVSEAQQNQSDGQFQKGSMGPKIRSAIFFLEHGGKKVVITNIAHIEKAISGTAGTQLIN